MALVGANVVVAKLLAQTLPIALVGLLRCALACVVLAPIALGTEGRVRIAPLLLGNLALQALLGTALYNAALLAGLRRTTALEAGLVLATLPAVVAIGAAVLLRERLRVGQWLGAALAVAGMAALTLADPALEEGGDPVGNLLVFAAVLGEASYVLLAKRLGGAVPVVTATLWMQVFSVAVLLPFAAGDLGAIGALSDPGLAALLVGHSLTASVLCVLLWYAGLRRVPAGVAGVFTALLPACAVLAGVTVLGERLLPVHGVGFGLMLTSMALATWPGRHPR